MTPLDALGNVRQFVPVPRGEKAPRCLGWPDIRLSPDELQRHLDSGGNVAMRLGPASDDIVDADLDCSEALVLADIYLPATQAEFGRASKPRSHRLYIAPGAIFASFADPTDGSMLLELRADGRDGGAHLTLIPPSVTDGERREWRGDTITPAEVDAAVLARRMAWLAIGCLTLRHVSEHAARRPGPDLPALLWEAEPVLGRAAYRWLGEPAPDEPRRYPRPRSAMSREAIDLAELVAAIPNNFDWVEWNRLGMAIYHATGGAEDGFIAFDDLSARSPKYNPHAVRERWRNYRQSPPSRIGLGTLVYLAREHGWRRGAAG
jgi:hypothetical protein